MEGVDDCAVALQGEDQGHVDADAFAQSCRDGGKAFQCCRNLDEDVALVDLLVELLGLSDRALRVPGQAGVDLDGDAAVDAFGGGGDRSEEVAAGGHVGRGHFKDGLLGRDALPGKVRELTLVGVGLGDGCFEDGGVGGHADDVLFVDELLQATAGEPFAGEVIQPDGDTGLGQLRCGCCVGHGLCFFLQK